MSGFDGNRYRKEVLKPLLDRGAFAVEDPFAVLALDPDVDDAATIGERLDEVVAFWRKEQSSPRYKGLVTSLLGEHDRIRAELLDPDRRAAARQRVRGATEAADREAAARVDELLDALERRHGGIPRDRVDRLRSLAGAEGISAAVVDDRLAHRSLIDDPVAATVEPIPAPQRKQVAALLAERARLDPDGGAGRTLYDFLGLTADATADQVEERRAAIDARNRQRRHDRLRTVVDELLALSETLLVTSDPARYLAGIVEDVRAELRPAIETAVLIDDRVGAAESERLTREAVSAGLDPTTARELVIGTARALGAPIDVGRVVDYVVCARCNATNPAAGPTAAGDDATCSRCGAELYRACPGCGETSARSAVRCPTCAVDLRAFDEALAAVDAAATVAEKEAALLPLVEAHPDAPALRRALAALPVAPATDVTVAAVDGTDTVRVHWAPSGSTGAVEYRVSRTVERTGGATTVLGRTRSTSLDDAAPPAGESVTYTVVAGRAGVESAPVTSPVVTSTPAVAGLTAIARDGAVELAWRAQAAGEVWVDRTVVAGPEGMDRRLRGGTTGVLDTAVRAGTTYRYTVVVEYPTSTGAVAASTPATVEAVAFALPDAPPAPTIAAAGRSLTLTVPAPGAGVETIVLRSPVEPAVAPGTEVDEAGRRAIGAPLAGRDGQAFDAADGGPRWYVPVAMVDGRGVTGPVVAHPGVAEVDGLRVEDGHLRWTWPTACTEVVIDWSAGPGPVVPDAPGVTRARTTNTAYDIKGGWPVPDGATAFLVRAAARIAGERVPIPAWSDRSTTRTA